MFLARTSTRQSHEFWTISQSCARAREELKSFCNRFEKVWLRQKHQNHMKWKPPRLSTAQCGTFEFLDQSTVFSRQNMGLWPRTVRLRETYTLRETIRWTRSPLQSAFSASDANNALEALESSIRVSRRCIHGIDPGAWQLIVVHMMTVALLCFDRSLFPMILAGDIPTRSSLARARCSANFSGPGTWCWVSSRATRMLMAWS